MLGQLHAGKRTALLLALLLTACTPTPSLRATPSAAPVPASASPTSLPACLDNPAVQLAPSGVTTSAPAWVIASRLDQPDDLVFHDGGVVVGQLGSGKVVTITPGLPPSESTWTVPKAEGIVFVGSTEYVADQADNSVKVIVAGQPQTFLQLQPVAGKDNLDGMGAQGSQLLIPDSPNGNLLWVDGSGQITRTVGGFNRPTGVWPLPDGSVLVADEYGNAVIKVAPDGSKTYLVQGLPIVDDVAADPAGRVFVVTPVVSGGRLAELVDGRARDLAGGMLEPQGLAFDGAGNVLVAESAAGRVDLFIRTFKLVPPAAGPAPGQPLCLHVLRAPGFGGDLQLTAVAGVTVVRQPGSADSGEVFIQTSAACLKLGCEITVTSGPMADSLWITG